jgi:hypothetical protein
MIVECPLTTVGDWASLDKSCGGRGVWPKSNADVKSLARASRVLRARNPQLLSMNLSIDV